MCSVSWIPDSDSLPISAFELQKRARVSAEEGDVDGAVATLSTLQEQNPTNYQFTQIKYDILVENGYYARAMEEMRTTRSFDQNCVATVDAVSLHKIVYIPCFSRQGCEFPFSNFGGPLRGSYFGYDGQG